MDFYDVLDQVIALLKQRGRASYRALQVQFALDHTRLEALKEELLYTCPQVHDDAGRGLIWTDLADAAREPGASVPQSFPPLSRPTTTPPQPSPEAERRQLTVMFCDLVGSTPLAERLDPEDYREVVRAYQQTCIAVIQRFDGHVAQLLGDALLVYFGWPQAHEDDAQRAVRAGLGMLEAMATLNTRLARDKRIRLSIRVGLHTGLVVVGEMGSGAHREQLALGETPNVASRLQGMAEPDTVMISEATYRLIEGYFTCEALGEQILKGVSQPLTVYRVQGESGLSSRLEIGARRGLTPLVGRDQEMGLLLERWRQARNGQGQVVVLSGEPGIGKSRLVQALKERIADTPHSRLECRSSPHYQHTAFYPLTDLLHRALRWQPHDTPEVKLQTLEALLERYGLALPETVPLLASLLALPVSEERYSPVAWSPQRQRQKTFETFLSLVSVQAEQRPVWFILEDLHWTDASTREWLDVLIAQTPTAAVLTLLTCRPEFQPPWEVRAHLTPLTLTRLSHPQVAQMVGRVSGGKRLPAEVLQHLLEKTDGVPLYVEEMTKAVLESGILTEADGQYEIAGSMADLAIPATLQDSLMARLDRLETAKGVAQIGATMGRQFSYALLQAVTQHDHEALQQQLNRLVDAELLYQRGQVPQATYTFKHALIQDAAYQSLLISTRQQQHHRIAEVLAQRFPEVRESHPEVLAHHYAEAGHAEQAIIYWQRAGQQALERSAHMEAITHLSKGLALLQALPDTPERMRHELALRISLGASLMATKGYAAPEVEQAYTRARELCQQLGETPQLFSVLRGLWAYYLTRMDLEVALEIAEQLQRLAHHAGNQSLRVRASFAVGQTFFHLGEFVAAHASLADGMRLFDAQHWSVRAMPDPGLGCACYMACVRWMRGYPDQSLHSIHEALRLAQEQSHAFTLAFTLLFAAICHDYRGEQQASQDSVDALIGLTTEQGFGYLLRLGEIMRGWGRCVHGQGEVGVAQIRQGLNAMQHEGAEILRPYFLALLANAYATQGQIAQGLEVLEEALAIGHETRQRYYEAELYRLKGELLLKRALPDASLVEACFQQALAVSRHQQAKSMELRAATSLARWWQQQGRRAEAHELLASVYQWFTEGFDTADLQEAKALLRDLDISV